MSKILYAAICFFTLMLCGFTLTAGQHENAKSKEFLVKFAFQINNVGPILGEKSCIRAVKCYLTSGTTNDFKISLVSSSETNGLDEISVECREFSCAFVNGKKNTRFSNRSGRHEFIVTDERPVVGMETPLVKRESTAIGKIMLIY